MKESQLKTQLKLLTTNQLKAICDYLLIGEFYPILEDYYLRRVKIFSLEYKYSMCRNRLVKILKFCRKKILQALKDDDFYKRFGNLF